jgi:hypothetical protein
MLIVVASYRQNVHAYPSGGGDYEVATVNVGPTAGLTVASALLVDYVLTVAVSVSAGVDNIISALPGLNSYRVGLALALLGAARATDFVRVTLESGQRARLRPQVGVAGEQTWIVNSRNSTALRLDVVCPKNAVDAVLVARDTNVGNTVRFGAEQCQTTRTFDVPSGSLALVFWPGEGLSAEDTFVATVASDFEEGHYV